MAVPVARLGLARSLFLLTRIVFAFTMKTSTGVENYGPRIGGLALSAAAVRYATPHYICPHAVINNLVRIVFSNVRFAFLLTPHPAGHRVCSSQRVSAIQTMLPSKLSRSPKPT